MKTLLNQFNSQIEKNSVNSTCSNLIADINTVIQMSQMIDDKTDMDTDFYGSVIFEFKSLVEKFTKEFADYVTEQDSQKVSDSKTK